MTDIPSRPYDLHRWARPYLERAFRFNGLEPDIRALQGAQSIAAREGMYATADGLGPLKGSNNWGNITCPCEESKWSPNCLKHGSQCYHVYQSPEEGAYEFVRILTRSPRVRDALYAGEFRELAAAMADVNYHKTPVNQYAVVAFNVSRDIARAIKEPHLWTYKGSAMAATDEVRGYMNRVNADYNSTNRIVADLRARQFDPNAPRLNVNYAAWKDTYLAWNSWYTENIGDWFLGDDEYNETRAWQVKLEAFRASLPKEEIARAPAGPTSEEKKSMAEEIGEGFGSSAGIALGGVGLLAILYFATKR